MAVAATASLDKTHTSNHALLMSSALTPPDDQASGSRIGDVILGLIGHIPQTDEALSATPAERARTVARLAAAKAGTTAGALAFAPGPLGWLTVLPELVAVWKIQTQMVADLAGIYGQTAHLSESQMVYCLFRHGAAMAVRDLVVRAGNRYLVKAVTKQALRAAARKIGVRITRQAAMKGVARWLPLVGAAGVGGYAYYDTAQVAKTAIAMFEAEIGRLE